MISTDGMNSYTENKDLNKEILLWINNRIISLLERYMSKGIMRHGQKNTYVYVFQELL